MRRTDLISALRGPASAGLVVLLAGCGTGPTGTPVPGCPANMTTGVLEPLGTPGSMGIFNGDRHLLIIWGDGTRTAVVDGTLSVVSPAGVITARVGDRLTLSGGEVRPGEFVACGPAPKP